MRRLLIFVICPIGLSYLIALTAQAAGMRLAGMLWFGMAFTYLAFGLPGLLAAVWLGREQRRDWLEFKAALTTMAIGCFVFASINYGTWFFTSDEEGIRRYSFVEASALALRDSIFNVSLAAVVVAVCVLIGKRVEVLIAMLRPKVR